MSGVVRPSLLLLLLPACAGSSGKTDTGDAPWAAESPCASGTWDSFLDPESAVHVRADGDDESGDGSADAPLASLQAGLDLARESDSLGSIAVGPGEFTAGVNLVAEGILSDDFSDDGLALQGCGMDETVLVADSDDDPLVRIVGAMDVVLSDLALQGGRRALWIWGGASADISDVSVVDSTKVGIVVADTDTVVSLTGVTVTDVQSDDTSGTEIGYGISIENGAATLSDTSVTGAVSVGILVNGGDAVMSGVTVQETAQLSDGTLGRGIQLQGQATAAITDTTLAGNSDAGLFSRQSTSLDVDGLVVEAVGWSEIPDDEDSSGDGIVVTGLDEAHSYDPAVFQTSVANSVLSDLDRAGMVLEHIEVAVEGNQIMNSALTSDDGVSIFYQDGAVVSGTDDMVELAEGGVMEPLSIFRDEVQLDTLDD
ncbi:MAG: right-handed parallel beta-helix repeat-containing protein [Myxococcota bacterium]|nr:right-handed parallel beta-helix repeat-containing protein [Myxococcota bacterium]